MYASYHNDVSRKACFRRLFNLRPGHSLAVEEVRAAVKPGILLAVSVGPQAEITTINNQVLTNQKHHTCFIRSKCEIVCCC